MDFTTIEFKRKKVFFVALVSALLTLAILFYVYEMKSLTILSPHLRISKGDFTAILNEYIPLTFIILILAWIRSGRLGNKEEKMGLTTTIFIIASSVLAVFIVFRFMDIMFMMIYPTELPLEELTFFAIWVRVSIYCLFSLILFAASTLFFGLVGLKDLFTISIIPAFYVLNSDLIMTANRMPALSILYPIYLSILEFGRWETVALGNILNLFGFKTLVYTNVFPYRLIMGGAIYLVDLPCIGWEGVVAYTIIFLNLIVDIEKRNKMRALWLSLGFAGTLFINLLRLVLIFVVGAIWGASSAQLIHYHAGDVIFLIWILGFTYVVFRLKRFRFSLHIRKNKKLNRHNC